MRIKIGIVEDKFTASSWYRSYGPLSRLAKQHNNIELYDLSGKEINYKSLLPLNIILISRPNSSGLVELIKLCKRLDIKVWIDLDDNLFEIPITNPAFYSYKNVSFLEESLALADIVTVSTDHLAKTIKQKLNIDSTVINNGIDLSKSKPYEKPDSINIVWRGSATHYADLEVYKDIFIKLSNKFNLYFFGVAPMWKINYNFIPGQNLFDFFNTFRNTNPTFLLYPLEENNFNYSKSNIAFLESAEAGAVTITNLVTNEWNWNCILHDPSIFDSSEKDLIDIHENYLALSRKIINSNYNIDELNSHRFTLLNN